MEPKTTVVAVAQRTAKASTQPSIEISRARGVSWPANCVSSCRLPAREGQSDAGRQQRHDQALGEQLAQQAAAAGAHRGADHQFLFAPRHARQDQVGHVGAGDQQHEGRRAQQRQQQGPRVLA